MRELDLHGMPLKQALATAAETISHLASSGQRGKLLVIHGYGSSGRGGEVRQQFRQWLDANGIPYLVGELAGGNPGVTTVLLDGVEPKRLFRETRAVAPSPGAPATASVEQLHARILELCVGPQPLSRICGKLRRFGDPVVRKAVEALHKSGRLCCVHKGKVKCYVVPRGGGA